MGSAEEEFDEFYARAYPRLVRQLYALTGDLPEAQDVVQEAFIRAWDRRGRFAGAPSQEAWIRTTAWRLAVSRFRRMRRGLHLLQRHHEHRDVEGPSPEHIVLVEALKTLPRKQRNVIVLYHLCDLSVEQISTETGWPAGSVRAWLVRGRLSLARCLSSVPDKEVDHVG
ncbi:SigE family RNA polymerase sigma factor [Streptomyces sp. S465]|uniref:SigE family RNA polymerase sigma factor n=1 Tax=Streptomyces sp. S465 TaxID=2979468 RepID=UPI0022A8CEEB|nr:SigE family RNA polymerase sigma factor [Streptomyces sp. S465]WAP57272.1 SigE family RNA polymerase sigma factor [Streptomyces sp. S465]